MNFKVMQIVMQRKFPFYARRERSSARRAREAGSLGRGGGAARRARAAGPGGRREAAAGCRRLLERFAWRAAGSEDGASVAASAPAPRCLEMDHLGARASPRERCCQAERGGNRERKSFSLITTSSPYLQYKGETK